MNSPTERSDKPTGGVSTAKLVLLGIVIFVVGYFIGPHLPSSHKQEEWTQHPFAAGALDTIMSATMAEKEVTFLYRHFDFEGYWVEACVLVVEGNPKGHQETFKRLIRSVRHT